jgi:N-acetylglutamate synthase-like GNAT family acetyltransferase
MLGSPPYEVTTLNFAIQVLPRDLRILFAVDCVEHVLWIIEGFTTNLAPVLKIIAGFRDAAHARSERFPSLRPINRIAEQADEYQQGVSAVDAFYSIATGGDAGGVANLTRYARRVRAEGYDDNEDSAVVVSASNEELAWQIERLRYYLREAMVRAEADEREGQYATLRGTEREIVHATLLRARALQRLRTMWRSTKSPKTKEKIEIVTSRLQEETSAEDIVQMWMASRASTPVQAAVFTINQLDDTRLLAEFLSKSNAKVGADKVHVPKKEPCQIFSLAEESDVEYPAGRDYYDVLREAEDLFINSNIRISRDEMLHEACLSAEGDVLGATVIKISNEERGMVLRFSVAVLEGARRQNIASRLVQSILTDARSIDVNVVEAWVVNPAMIPLLDKLGFEEPHGGWSQNNPMMEYAV